MIDYCEDENLRIINGDCLAVLKELPDNSIDAVVTDPPYELGFIGIELEKEYCKIAKARIDAEQSVLKLY